MIRFRVESGFRPPFQICPHRHRSYMAARRCAEGPGPSDAVRIVAINDLNVQVHVELRDGSRVAGEPWQPSFTEGGSK